MNGASVYVGRSRNSIFAGRGSPSVQAGVNFDGGYTPNANGSQFWPTVPWRNSGSCRPIVQCCCKGPIFIAPGEIQSVMMNWGQWIDSVPGYVLDSIASASLSDPMNAMEPADPDVIKITTGMRDKDPDPPDNSDVAGLVSLVPPYGTQILVEVAKDARIGSQFKLDVCLTAHDCDGRRIRQCDCLIITIAEC